jgi:phage shock protein C
MTATSPTFTPTPSSPATPKRLYRSREDRMLGGVCGGLGGYLGVDPTLVRILAVLSLFLPGPQILAYLIAWIIVPEEPLVAVHPSPNATPAAAHDVEADRPTPPTSF